MECLMKENLGDYDSGVIATWYMAKVMRHHFSFECLLTYLANLIIICRSAKLVILKVPKMNCH